MNHRLTIFLGKPKDEKYDKTLNGDQKRQISATLIKMLTMKMLNKQRENVGVMVSVMVCVIVLFGETVT